MSHNKTLTSNNIAMSYKNPFLVTDFYKLCHMLQYPDGLSAMTSYMVPRFSRLSAGFGIDKVTFFGLTSYIHDFVVEEFNKEFFGRPFAEVEGDVTNVLRSGLRYYEDSGLIGKTIGQIRKLHAKGFLPVRITGLPEGVDVPMGCPCVAVTSTDTELPWVGQVLEASMSAALWHPMVSATVARRYRVIAERAYRRTVDDDIQATSAMCDFSMRGQESVQSSIAASAGWLTAMHNSSTVAARAYIEHNYPDGRYATIRGLTSTEHSVMCTHAALGTEESAFDHLFNLYSGVSFAAVCDSYNFWNVVTNILPKYGKVIDERGRRGLFIGVRHDSAEPVTALCGIPVTTAGEFDANIRNGKGREGDSYYLRDAGAVAYWNTSNESWSVVYRNLTNEEKGMVEVLGELFGISLNSKGFKVLNPGVKAVYGDSITVTRAEQIYKRLEAKGYAANNVSLGVGSFSFQCMESTDGKLSPFTRDTFSIAMKCTYAVHSAPGGESKPVKVYKDPKGFSEKKSLKGLCKVEMDDKGFKVVGWRDEVPAEEFDQACIGDLPVTYFSDGACVLHNFANVRNIVTASVDSQLEDEKLLEGGEKLYNHIRDHITSWASSTGAKNFVVGLSGGKDSTVVAMLLTSIFGADRVYGAMLPVQRCMKCNRKPCDDLSVAWQVADLCGLSGKMPRHVYELPIEASQSSISNWVVRGFGFCATGMEAMLINLPARIRMTCLFAIGQLIDGRVINTSNLSEDTVGYATQFGDNAGCYAPLQDLTVTEVRQLGMWLAVSKFHMSIPEAYKLVYRVPADGLQPKTDEERLGFSYGDLDKLIRTGEGSDEFKERIYGLYKRNKFKTDIVQMPKATFPWLRNFVKEHCDSTEEHI